ncbi:MAG: VWA domain-containing protein [Anaerolineae bacterium]|nr:VWA domain-containing protein [Anaerolineae bacterium]MDQ7035657.1 VWA domain-containing protein [Anaerolineae bacterium]
MRKLLSLIILLMFALTACNSVDGSDGSSLGAIPENAIEITIIYAPESDAYMPEIMSRFNESYRNGRNPVTGQELQSGERPIYISGQPGSSGVVTLQIVNAVTNPASGDIARPTIFQPSVSHWLALANHEANRDLFDLADSPGTALAPVVMAIWESRLQAIRDTVGYDDIGWEELLDVLNSPNGWQDYGIADGRRTVYYGHTDPYVSSTALSTLIAEYYASANANGFTGRRLTMDVVQDETIQEGVRDIEQLIRHYSRRTTEFKNYIAQGPDYLDFVALEENDLIAINRGQTDFQPPEQLVALYPKEGTFWHEHPFGIPNASWVSEEQRQAARNFADFVLLAEQQEFIMTFGFRPANPSVALGFPIEPQFGVTVEGPTTVLDVPDAEVIGEIQESWSFVKKQADILIVIDVSGSMQQDNKITQARQAALAFLDNTEATNRVGLAVFSTNYRVVVPIDVLENNIVALQNAINDLQADGGTALFSAVVESTKLMEGLGDSDRIRAVVFLSDGEDTASPNDINLNAATDAIEQSYSTRNPVIFIPVGYGNLSSDLQRVLDSLGDASNTQWIAGNPNTINELLELISSFF